MSLHPSTCPLDCPDSCGVLLETDEHGRFTGLRGNPDHSWSEGHLCGKTAIYHEVALGANRLKVPLVRQGGALREASWDEALDRIAEGVGSLDGEELLALSYAGSMGLMARHGPMRVMNALGARCTDGSICDSTSAEGHQVVLGDAVGPDLERVVEADLLVIWGCDARRTMQHLMPRVKQILHKGGQVVVIDVYRTDTLRMVEGWGGRGLVVSPGSDASLALGLCERAFQNGSADISFLKEQCMGAAELRAEIAGAYTLERVAGDTGLAPSEIEWLSSCLAGSSEAWIKTGIGWNRRRNGAMSMRAVCSLAAVLGIADHLHFESGDHFGLDNDWLSQPERLGDRGREPIRHIEVGRELEAGHFRGAVVWGHNPAVVLPESGRVQAGLARDDLFLVVHELVLTETARLADVVLPATALPEYTDVFKSYGHRVLQISRKVCDAPAEQRSNLRTFASIAQRLGMDEDLCRLDEEELLTGFMNHHRSRFTDGEFERLQRGEPVKLQPRSGLTRGTPSGRIELASDQCDEQGQGRVAAYVPDDGCSMAGRFWLHPTPSVATHNSTYSHSGRHVRRAGSPRVWVHPEDARELGLTAGQDVRLHNEVGSLTLSLALNDDAPRGMVRVEGFPDPAQTSEGLSTNALTRSTASDLAAGFCQFSARVDLSPA
ncbi:MAG: hypothetical protein CMJ98_00865 [Planctomycetes bacterium]|nr:hypothetical protein [Planctomycetota bacterium]